MQVPQAKGPQDHEGLPDWPQAARPLEEPHPANQRRRLPQARRHPPLAHAHAPRRGRGRRRRRRGLVVPQRQRQRPLGPQRAHIALVHRQPRRGRPQDRPRLRSVLAQLRGPHRHDQGLPGRCRRLHGLGRAARRRPRQPRVPLRRPHRPGGHCQEVQHPRPTRPRRGLLHLPLLRVRQGGDALHAPLHAVHDGPLPPLVHDVGLLPGSLLAPAHVFGPRRRPPRHHGQLCRRHADWHVGGRFLLRSLFGLVETLAQRPPPHHQPPRRSLSTPAPP